MFIAQTVWIMVSELHGEAQYFLCIVDTVCVIMLNAPFLCV